jgi:deoxyadenosine/deoxycytidine kinase
VIIWLSGPTGAGKTSLARSLHKKGYSIVEERIPEILFRAFAADPVANCEPLQRHLMQSRINGWREVARAPRVAFDRSIDEDLEVFCRMHMRRRLLTEMQFNSLAQFGRSLQDQIPRPDLIVFVTSTPEVLFRRIQNLNSPSPILESLEDQISLYSEWLRTRNEEVLNLDTSRLSERVMASFFTEI